MNKLIHILILVLITFGLLLQNVKASSFRQDRILAFPGAEGAGKYTSGGRGGIIYTVTNLNDDGPGSFRDGIQKKCARIIVFAVSGYIELESRIDINHGDLTIAGQSAPGEAGICLKNYGLRINADNVVIRYLKIRPGDVKKVELDALTGMRQRDIIVDHCSLSWATDEVCSLYDIENLTLQWCIISESLNQSYHSKGNHGYGGIWGGMNATFHHNLILHHTSRNPRLQGSRRVSTPENEYAEIVNNVIYNWGSKCMYAGEAGHYTICNNYFKAGPATKKSAKTRLLEPYEPYSIYHFENNILDGDEQVIKNNLKGVQLPIDSTLKYFTKTPKLLNNYQLEPAIDAFNHVLEDAGASLHRDKIDARLVDEVRYGVSTFGEAGIINSQSDVGGWPIVEHVFDDPDSDNDGIPDLWEIKNGLDQHDKEDANRYNLNNQYTNIEVFLNSLIKN